MIEFLQDDDRIREERKRAKATRDKYVGMSHEAPSYRSRSFRRGKKLFFVTNFWFLGDDDERMETINRSKTEDNFRRRATAKVSKRLR